MSTEYYICGKHTLWVATPGLAQSASPGATTDCKWVYWLTKLSQCNWNLAGIVIRN